MPVTGILQALAGQPFRAVLDEWRIHLEAEQDPTIFANLFLELMCDRQNIAVRQACAMFAAYMKQRSWNTVKREFAPFLDEPVKAAFRRPNAATFYSGFRDMVVEAIRDYWTQFLDAKKGKKGTPFGPKEWSPRAKKCFADGNICSDPRHHHRCGRRG